MGLSDIFGGSKKVSTLTSGQRNVLDGLSGKVMEALGRPGEVYQGATVPGRDQLMTEAYGRAADGGFDMNPNITSALNAALSGGQDTAGVRQMFEGALAPARQEFDRALDTVGARYGDTWGSNGALPDMVGRTTAEYGSNLNNLLGKLTYESQQSAADRQLQAIPAALGVEQQQGQNLAGLYGMGEANRAVEGQENASEYNKWLSGQWYNNPALGFINPVLGTSAYGIGQQGGILSGAAQAVGGVAQGVSAFRGGN